MSLRPRVVRRVTRVAALLLVGALAACGGDGDRSTATGGLGGSGGGPSSAGSGGAGGPSSAGSGGAGGAPAINECMDGTASCAPHALCVDTPGFYECVCEPGYDGDGKTACADIDECQFFLHDCASNATCTNTEGGFTCACPSGLVGDGKTCAPTYVAVAAGFNHACAIRSDKTLWCWGHNTSNQVGTGLPDPWFTRPVTPSDATDWSEVSVGENFSCAMNAIGAVACWGSNSSGQFGDGTTTSKSTPSLAAGGAAGWKSIEAGRLHICALKSDGKGFCWGRNANGQLGDGTKDNNNDGTADNEPSPVAIVGDRTWLVLSAGNEHTCGVTTGHALYCWGLNSSNQLGDGTTTERQAPVPIGLATDWATVDAGANGTCAVKLNGERWCWGANGSGQLGDGTTSTSATPKRADEETDWSVVQLSAESFACGVRVDGRVYCWGDGSVGQTAQPLSPSVTTKAVQVGGEPGWLDLGLGGRFACGIKANGELVSWGSTSRAATGSGFTSDRLEPSFVGTDSDWTAIAAHADFTCGLRGTKLYCWGRNLLGNLGDGTTSSSVTPTAIDPLIDYASVVVGRAFGCGLTSGGDVRCWGIDSSGQLGNGSMVGAQMLPSPLAPTPGNSSPWTALAAGENTACGLRSDKTLWCWGSDAAGQVGNGAITGSQHSPVQISSAEVANWESVTAAADAFCARRTGGAVWCWGRGAEGQQGNGSTANVTAPQQVGAASYAIVAMGRSHACAVRGDDGTLWCWGRNSSGELGLGNSVNPVTTPTQVGSETDWSTVHLGAGTHGCARKTSGALHCVGGNSIGQLGQGTLTSSNKMLLVPVPWKWKTASVGNEVTCAIRDDGRLMCWGSANTAQLGGGVPFHGSPTTVLPPL